MAKKEKHPTMEELMDVDSKYSSMRWAFLMMVKLGAWMSMLSIIGMIIVSILDKYFPAAGAAAILGVIFTTAFSGKAAQSFAEHPTLPNQLDDSQK
jgi:hypothetical protein